MPSSPKELTDRPAHTESQRNDVFSDLLDAMRLSTVVYGRFEAGAPWGVDFTGPKDVSLYLMARGGAELEVEGVERPVLLSAGDVAVITNGAPHILHDAPGSPLYALGEGECRRSCGAEPIRFGGDGARSSFLAGGFGFGSTRRTLLFERLPPVIHIAASDPHATPWLPATVQLLSAESSARQPGGTVVISRLVDILLVHTLRTFIAGTECQNHGLRALADPQIGRALQLIHDRPQTSWTVDSLASAVGLSRSGFAARFRDLVGDPPLEYIARWRMTKAAELLRESDLPMIDVADRVGYSSEAAFNRAFKRWEGTAPATYRRQRLAEAG